MSSSIVAPCFDLAKSSTSGSVSERFRDRAPCDLSSVVFETRAFKRGATSLNANGFPNNSPFKKKHDASIVISLEKNPPFHPQRFLSPQVVGLIIP